MITIIAGGTGSIKLVRGLAAIESDVNVICNVADNLWMYGMYICPDIDTTIYGLADLLDRDKGWGIRKDTFNFLRQMESFGEETWFRIGDRDAATHLMRTNMLKNGKNLSEITRWMCKKFAISANVIPATDSSVETIISTHKGEMSLQEYWVKNKGREQVTGIRYEGIDKARPNPDVDKAIQDSKLVVIAPGNPLTSIGPSINLHSIQKSLTRARKKTIAVSPIIGNQAIRGPAGQYMKAAGLDVNSVQIAKMYATICSGIVIDSKDKALAKKMTNMDMDVHVTKIIMKNKQSENTLASFVLNQA